MYFLNDDCDIDLIIIFVLLYNKQALSSGKVIYYINLFKTFILNVLHTENREIVQEMLFLKRERKQNANIYFLNM